MAAYGLISGDVRQADHRRIGPRSEDYLLKKLIKKSICDSAGGSLHLQMDLTRSFH
jgi:hypothetical protein